MRNFFLTIPHSGRAVPSSAKWLKSLPPSILNCDVDAFVDELYAPAIEQLRLTALIFPWHRYAVDANRLPKDRTGQTVKGAPNRPLSTSTEIHWRETTRGDSLIKAPISKEEHEALIKKYYQPFHKEI